MCTLWVPGTVHYTLYSSIFHRKSPKKQLKRSLVRIYSESHRYTCVLCVLCVIYLILGQNAVFKNIQSYWNEYQNFLDDSNNVTSIEAAIGELKKQIEEERVRMKEMENTEQIEQERSKLSMPRFETIEEKKQRLKREQETKEFGEVAVSFRLSQLNPNFKFYFNDNGSTSAPELASEWISTLKSTSKVRKTVHYEQYSN